MGKSDLKLDDSKITNNYDNHNNDLNSHYQEDDEEYWDDYFFRKKSRVRRQDRDYKVRKDDDWQEQ